MEHHQRVPKKVLSPLAKLARLTSELEKNPGDYEPIAPSDWPPLQVFLPDGRKPRRALFLTKDSVLIRLMAEDLLPHDAVVLCRYGLPTEKYAREARMLLSRSARAIFVGDLDPLDLHVYLSLRRGNSRLKLEHGGLNDACLDLCERNLKKGQRLESALIRMGERERRHFAILDSLVDVTAIVGERSRDLLRSGFKLELEGATNATLFREGHLSSFLTSMAPRP